MITKWQQRSGTGFHYWLRNILRFQPDAGGTKTAQSIIRGQNQDTWFDFDEEFLDTGGTAPMSTDYSPTGSPAYDYVANGIGGQVQAILASSPAAMIAGSGWDDSLQIDATKPFIVEWRSMTPDDLDTNEYLLIGATGAIKTGVNPNTLAGLKCAAFYVDEDNEIHILIMGGADADVDYSTGRIIDADTFYWWKVENLNGRLRFYFGPGMGDDGSELYDVQNSFADGVKFQPLAAPGKLSGATQPSIINDRLKGHGFRTEGT